MAEGKYIDSDGTELRVEQDDWGNKRYRNSKGQFHRLDGPAVEWASGTKEWYQNSQRHRLDGPAAEHANGTKHWFQNNQFHRLDGPAVECADGYKSWYQNDQYHRLDGPAVEYPDGYKEWWIQDERVEPLFLVAYWLERGRCCWYDEAENCLRFS